MVLNATFNKLIQISYDELSLKETARFIEYSEDSSQELCQSLGKISSVKEQLNTFSLSPSRKVIKAILKYSQRTKTKTII